MKIKNLLLIIPFVFLNCKENMLLNFKPSNPDFQYNGRFETLQNGSTALISSAASVEFKVKGDSINLFIQSEITSRNYFVLTINDIYQKRYLLEGNSIQKIALKLKQNETNKIGIYKATEASSGSIIFHGIEAEALIPIENKSYTLEFIGDSITCGALADNSDVNCNEGEYIDQHNAYLAYGPQIAKELNANFILSAVSGIGMYRNWNDDTIDEPIMPQVYKNLYLNTDASKTYNFSIQPDLVSICLGTNDMSDGDGIKERLPFDSTKYIENYINFIKTVYSHYPKTKILLLNSPMVDGEKNNILVSCLNKVIEHFKEKNITLYEFKNLYVNGCNYHPSIQDHKEIADQLIPIFKKILDKPF
tara:strand:- start:58340 stop:59425 length:1086 start_codon:yes stop_codon:yes gene_type:complete